MSTGLTNQLEALEKPLLFVSRNNFKNLRKVKNLERTIDEISLKLISQERDPAIKKEIKSIRSSFSGFIDLDEENKIFIIKNALDKIAKLNSIISPEQNSKTKSDLAKLDNVRLEDPVRYLKGVGPRISALLSKRKVERIEDLLFYFPRKYEDRRNVKKISSIDKLEKVVVFAKIVDFNITSTRGKKIYKALISDGTGEIILVWFSANEKYLRNTYKKGMNIVVSGEISYNNYDKTLQIIHPRPEDVELFEEDENLEDKMHFDSIVPIYPLTEGLTQKRTRSIIRSVVEQFSDTFEGIIPDEITGKNSLIPLSVSLREVQFPKEYEKIVDLSSSKEVYNSKPHKTIAFYEFLLLELGLFLKKRKIEKSQGISFNTKGEITKRFKKSLPFQLTESQEKVISEIDTDMASDYPMNRLLQGDVGSGKTVVSIISLLKAFDSGYQSVLMAPTEILCEQHYNSVSKLLNGIDIKIVLLKSALGAKQKRSAKKQISSGEAHIIIGTHALIEEDVKFDNLGLVVIDEQHRFGVMQRAKLMSKGINPDVLVMTATPIPRTLAITVYGDLDISVIDGMPPGRKEIITKLYKEGPHNRSLIYEYLKEEMDKGRQGYVVCPFIDESENSDFQHINYATKVFDTLSNEVFNEYKVGLLHGQMNNEEKENVMKSFLLNEVQLLVSTTVVEVGVDISNATFMVIENSERYGLSQLHQLRGRIGRGMYDSVCILIANYALSENADKKLKIMTRTNDGFKIAEADLGLRGPGDFLGTKQSGIPEFRFANLIRDWKILSEARNFAAELIAKDPELKGYPEIKRIVKDKWGEMLELNVLS